MQNTEPFKFSDGQHRGLNAKFNTVGGNPRPAPGGLSMTEVVTRLRRQVGLVASEHRELTEEGLAAQDTTLVRDGVADVLVTIDGLYHRVGLEYPAQLHSADSFPEVREDQIISVVNGAITGSTIALNMLDELGQQLEIYRIGDAEGQDMPFPAGIALQQVNLWSNVILVAMHSIGHALRFDLIEDQNTVFASNMSKFTQDLEVANQGVAKYAALNVPAEVFEVHADGEIYYVVKCTADGPMVGLDGGDYSPGKILKGVGFHKPKWTEISEEAKRRFAILFGQIEPTALEEAPTAVQEEELPDAPAAAAWSLDGNDVAYVELTWKEGDQFETARHYSLDQEIICAEKAEVGKVETFTQSVSEVKVGQLAHTYTGPLDAIRLSEITNVVHYFPEPTKAETDVAADFDVVADAPAE